MKRTYKMINGHIVVKNPLMQELPALAIRLKSGRTTYRFCGSYDGRRSISAKVLRLMEQDGDVDGEKTGEA